MRLTYLGHAGFKITSDKVIYIDPFQISDTEKADIILITHTHYDHFSEKDIKKIKKADTKIVAPTDATIDSVPMRPGDIENVDGITVEAVAAYNTDKNFHQKTSSWNGYIITIEGKRIYHAGDTDIIPEMNSIKADVALLPVSGTYVMTAEQAAQAALTIKPKLAIPMHFGSIVGSRADAEAFDEKLKGKIKVNILNTGESLEI